MGVGQGPTCGAFSCGCMPLGLAGIFALGEGLAPAPSRAAERYLPAAGPEYAARVLRTKTYVSQEATRLCAELFSLSGGRHFRRTSPVARALADSFASTALRPPLALALDLLVENFSLGEAA